jgi:hypothetical protein
LEKQVREKTREELERRSILYSSRQRTNGKDIVDTLDEFATTLRMLLIEKKYSPEKVGHLEKEKMITLNGTTYYRCEATNVLTSKSKIEEACTEVAKNSEVKDALKLYHEALERRNETYKHFGFALKVLLRKPNLKFRKEWLIKLKCPFVKTDLT